MHVYGDRVLHSVVPIGQFPTVYEMTPEMLEAFMNMTPDEQLAAVNANVDNIRGDVEWLHGELVRIQGEAEAKDAAFAAALQPLVDITAEIAGRTPEPTPGEDPAPVEPGDGEPGDVA